MHVKQDVSVSKNDLYSCKAVQWNSKEWSKLEQKSKDYSSEEYGRLSIWVRLSQHFRSFCKADLQLRSKTLRNSIKSRLHVLDGEDKNNYIENVPSGIYECNNGCQCSQNCSNRITQKGVTTHLEGKYEGDDKGGWTVYSRETIPVRGLAILERLFSIDFFITLSYPRFQPEHLFFCILAKCSKRQWTSSMFQKQLINSKAKSIERKKSSFWIIKRFGVC